MDWKLGLEYPVQKVVQIMNIEQQWHAMIWEFVVQITLIIAHSQPCQ